MLIGFDEFVQKIGLIFGLHPYLFHLRQSFLDTSHDSAILATIENLMSNKKPFCNHIYILSFGVFEVIQEKSDVFELLEILFVSGDVGDAIKEFLSLEVYLEVLGVVQPREVFVQIVVLQNLHHIISMFNGSITTYKSNMQNISWINAILLTLCAK